jgi:hypothetical protein
MAVGLPGMSLGSVPSDSLYSGGPLRIASRDQAVEILRREQEAKRPVKQDSENVTNLVGYLRGVWETNRRHKDEGEGCIQSQMLANLRARLNQYDESTLAAIQKMGGSDIYMGLTGVKCRGAEAWMLDVFAGIEKPWAIRPTPEPDITDAAKTQAIQLLSQRVRAMQQQNVEITAQDLEDQMQVVFDEVREELTGELRSRTAAMETKIHDQLVEGGWYCAFSDFVADLVTLKAGIIKGPIPRMRKVHQWQWDPVGRVNLENVTEEVRCEYERVSPFDLYPDPDARTPDDGNLCERVKLSRRELGRLKNQPGYDAKAIDALLAVSETHTESPSDQDEPLEEEREDLELRDPAAANADQRSKLTGIEFWCTVQGRLVKEHGVTKLPNLAGPIEDNQEYEINAILIGDKLIYIDVNAEPYGCRPYSVSGWAKMPGSFWYQGVPELMSDLQRACNAAARALMNNLGVASGPQAEVDVSRMLPGEDIESIFPMKVWQTHNKNNSSAPAIRFFSPNSNANELLGVYDRFASLADDYTGIPAYAYGNERVAGAGRTSSGLSALMSAAAKGIKRVFLQVDKQVVSRIVKKQFDWNMKYLGEQYRGDIEVVPTGIVAIMAKEQLSERRIQFLNATANEYDMELMGPEGRAEVLREVSASLDMPGKELIKQYGRLKRIEREKQERAQAEAEAQNQAAQAKAQREQAEGQARMLEAQAKILEAQVRQQQLQLEIARAQTDAQFKGVSLDIDRIKVESEAIKDRAVAADLGLRGLMDASGNAGVTGRDLSGDTTKPR